MGLRNWLFGTSESTEVIAPPRIVRRIEIDRDWLDAAEAQFEQLQELQLIGLIRDVQDHRNGDPTGLYRNKPSLIGVRRFEEPSKKIAYSEEPAIHIGGSADLAAPYSESISRRFGLVPADELSTENIQTVVRQLLKAILESGDLKAFDAIDRPISRICREKYPEGDDE